jgi:hypothetical protein
VGKKRFLMPDGPAAQRLERVRATGVCAGKIATMIVHPRSLAENDSDLIPWPQHPALAHRCSDIIHADVRIARPA